MYPVNMSSGRVLLSSEHPARPLDRSGRKLSSDRKNASAFTLIEVVFSLGICSFALVGMLGLMAVGLTTLRQSMDYNTETVITQQLSGEAQVLDYSNITNSSSSYRLNFQNNRYFDEYGAELTNSPVPANYVYMASLTVTNCQLPGMTANSPVAQELIFQISTPRHPGSVNSYYLWTVDNGR
jgi:uncharacterized protein (TIGR02598 family)